MTHTRQMAEHEGEFGEAKCSDQPCHNCNTVGSVTYTVWESSCGGYEDFKYACKACGHTWWVDGIDS
jgi:RecJ-like exonuclease